MIIKQFYLGCLAHASYIVVDEASGRAVVIDPRRDVQQYLDAADELGASIEAVLLTHFHADFVAGHLELRERVGAWIGLGARGAAEYDVRALHEGDVIELGDARLSILETPGHTPEGISIVATDAGADPAVPVAVFTGDTLFVGDVGRPDLLASAGVTSDELAGWLYDSLHDKLLALPDATTVYPAHGAGSLCGKNLGKETFSTIGEQRRGNYALQPMSKAEFKAIVTEAQPEVPGYFVHDVMLNKSERPTLDATLPRTLKPLTPEDVEEAVSDGAVVVDTRESSDFLDGHLPGSLNVGLAGKFATWAGTLLRPDQRIVILAAPGKEEESAVRLGRIGLDGVVGFVDGGPGALSARSLIPATSVRALESELQGSEDLQVLDVRTAREWEGGHVEGSLNIPLNQLQRRIAEVPRDRPLAVVCKSGYRSSAACSVLARAGVGDLRNVTGGMDAWTAEALPVTASVDAAGSCSA